MGPAGTRKVTAILRARLRRALCQAGTEWLTRPRPVPGNRHWQGMRLALVPRSDATCCGEQNGKSVLEVIRRRFVPPLARSLTATCRNLSRPGYQRGGNPKNFIILSLPPHRERMTRDGAVNVFGRFRPDSRPGVILAIQHVVWPGRTRTTCCGEQNLNQRESLIRRLFVPDSFQGLIPGTFFLSLGRANPYVSLVSPAGTCGDLAATETQSQKGHVPIR